MSVGSLFLLSLVAGVRIILECCASSAPGSIVSVRAMCIEFPGGRLYRPGSFGVNDVSAVSSVAASSVASLLGEGWCSSDRECVEWTLRGVSASPGGGTVSVSVP